MQNARLDQSIISYNATISALGKGGQQELAVRLFDEMPHAGFSSLVQTMWFLSAYHLTTGARVEDCVFFV
ncbi:unnamed protein product [Symbiodinium sp. KB8]|nr:unnamed protein product [Symbiodinium sp. KB8]